MDDSWGQTLQTLVGGVIGFGAGVLAEPCRAWLFHPTVKFQSGTYSGSLIETIEKFTVPDGVIDTRKPHEAMYYRVRLVNQGRAVAKSVRVFLTGLESHHSNGGWGDTGFADTLILPWACRGDAKLDAVDLPRGVPHFVDLMSSREPLPNALRMEADGWPFRCDSMIAPQGIYRFRITATGENFRPVSTWVTLTWNGHWKDLRMTSGA